MSQEKNLLPMELPLMSSQGDSHAKILAKLGSNWELEREHALASGQRLPVLLGSYDQSTSSWRTSQHCLVAQASEEAHGLAEFSETWPRSGMMRSGTAYRLPPLARSITEIGSGLLPTPRANNNMNAKISERLATRTRDGKLRLNLEEVVSRDFYPTPTAHNAKEGAYPSEYNRNTPTLASIAGGRLNPEWVEWLMGYPIMHTDLKD